MFGRIPLDNIGVQAGLHFIGVSNDLALAGWQCPVRFQTSLQHQTYSEHLRMDEKSANPGANSKQHFASHVGVPWVFTHSIS